MDIKYQFNLKGFKKYSSGDPVPISIIPETIWFKVK